MCIYFKTLLLILASFVDTKSTEDAKIRRRVLNKLENESNLTLQNLAEDCLGFINVWQDAKDIESCSDGEPSYWITISGWNSCHQVSRVPQTDCPDLSPKIVNLCKTVIVSLQAEVEIKKKTKKKCNTAQELPVTLEEIKKIKHWMYIQFAMTFWCTAKE